MDATIIVVEDEPGIRATLCGILMEDAGYKVIGLERGADALQMIRRSPFDVLIADIRLPDVSGLEILELAKEINPDAAVIVMTGYASVETAVDAVNQGAYAYFVKPVNPDEIKTTIANALKQQRLSLENKKLVEDLQRTNKLLLEANAELQKKINERNRVRKALQESEERYRDLFENANDLIQSVTPDGRFLYVNKAWREMLGYSEEEVANLRLWDIIHPDSIPHCREVFQKVISGETANNIETVFMAKDGKLITVEGNANAWSKEGKVVATRGIFRGITERKRAEEALQKSEESYRALFENLNDAAFLADTETGRILDTNKQGEVLLGRSREEIIGMHQRELHPPEKADEYGQRFATHVQKGRAADYDGEAIREDGSIVPVSISAAPVAIGEKQLILGLFRDITERKRAEEALRESEEKYRALVENANEAIIVAQGDKACFVNPKTTELMGYSKEEITTRPFLEFIHPDDREKIIESYMRRLAGEEPPVNLSLRVIDKIGNTRWVEVNSGSITWEGSPAALALLNDITERKQAGEALKEAEELYLSMANNPHVGFYIIQDGKYVFVNQRLQEGSGYTEAELLSMGPLVTVHPDDREMAREKSISMLKGELGTPFECRSIVKDGGTRVIIQTATSVQYKGKRAHLGCYMDITERKQMEEALREKSEQLDAQNEELQSQAEELMSQQEELIEKTREVERANRLKSEFLSGMSHELRTPLNVIIGFSELMVDEVPGKTNEEQRQCLNDILDSGRHLLNLINGVLDLARIESGKVELKLENIALTEVIESLTRAMMPVLAPRKQSLDAEIEERLPLVYADEVKLGQVLLNLVDNSSKFTPDGGKLKIEAVREGDWCRVSVVDNGLGIREEDQERIFEPFCQLDNPLVKERGGTGLGLALVKQIVERYGGRIWVESEPGRGSRFNFTLPLATSS